MHIFNKYAVNGALSGIVTVRRAIPLSCLALLAVSKLSLAVEMTKVSKSELALEVRRPLPWLDGTATATALSCDSTLLLFSRIFRALRALARSLCSAHFSIGLDGLSGTTAPLPQDPRFLSQ